MPVAMPPAIVQAAPPAFARAHGAMTHMADTRRLNGQFRCDGVDYAIAVEERAQRDGTGRVTLAGLTAGGRAIPSPLLADAVARFAHADAIDVRCSSDSASVRITGWLPGDAARSHVEADLVGGRFGPVRWRRDT